MHLQTIYYPPGTNFPAKQKTNSGEKTHSKWSAFSVSVKNQCTKIATFFSKFFKMVAIPFQRSVSCLLNNVVTKNICRGAGKVGTLVRSLFSHLTKSNKESSKAEQSKAPKAEQPEAAEIGQPEASKAEQLKASKAEQLKASKAEQPEAAEIGQPEAAKTGQPEALSAKQSETLNSKGKKRARRNTEFLTDVLKKRPRPSGRRLPTRGKGSAALNSL